MNQELFPPSTVAGESPRLRWIKQYGLTVLPTNQVPHWQDDPRMAYKLEAVSNFSACRGFGDTEDDALADWAHTRGVRLWNEAAIT